VDGQPFEQLIQADYLSACHKSFSRSGRSDTHSLRQIHGARSDPQSNQQVHRPTNHKSSPPTSQQMLENFRVVKRAFLAHAENVDIHALKFL
jgi:hypothetical protein